MHEGETRSGDGEDDPAARAVHQEYAGKARRKLVGTIVVMGGVGIGIFGLLIGVSIGLAVFEDLWGILGVLGGLFLLALGFSIFQLINWRCPRCQASFKALRNPRFCHNCGVRLRE